MTYIYNIQYDDGDQSRHVFTAHCGGEDAEDAIREFRKIYDTERILSVEMVAQSDWDKCIRGSDDDIHAYMEMEENMRYRVIRALSDAKRG